MIIISWFGNGNGRGIYDVSQLPYIAINGPGSQVGDVIASNIINQIGDAIIMSRPQIVPRVEEIIMNTQIWLYTGG